MTKNLIFSKYSKQWFDFSMESQENIRPAHGALYLFLVYAKVSKKEFSPYYVMQVSGIRSFRLYQDTLSDLQKWGFINVIGKSGAGSDTNMILLSTTWERNKK